MNRAIATAIFLSIFLALAYGKTSATPSDLQPILAAKENGFFQSWKDGKRDYFEHNTTADSVFFGDYGVSSKSETLEQQRESITSCKVQSFTLSNFKPIPLTKTSAILLYDAEQHAICGGQTVPVYMNGESVYVQRNGKWLNVLRSEVPARQRTQQP